MCLLRVLIHPFQGVIGRLTGSLQEAEPRSEPLFSLRYWMDLPPTVGRHQRRWKLTMTLNS